METCQLYCGDCRELMRRMAQSPLRADLIFADPPYNIGLGYDVYDDRRRPAEYLAWTREWVGAAVSVLSPYGTMWVAIGDEYAAEVKCICSDHGLHLRNWVIWHYTFSAQCSRKFARSHVHLLYFVKDLKRFVFNSRAIRVPSARACVYNDKRAAQNGRLPDDVWVLRPQDCAEAFSPASDTWHVPRVNGTFKERARFHPCQMPEAILERIVLACSDRGDLVLDPFAGTGSALCVAKRLARRWIGFEISKRYVQGAIERIEAVDDSETEAAMDELL